MPSVLKLQDSDFGSEVQSPPTRPKIQKKISVNRAVDGLETNF